MAKDVPTVLAEVNGGARVAAGTRHQPTAGLLASQLVKTTETGIPISGVPGRLICGP